MRELFADTFFWTALADPSDQWHSVVRRFDAALDDALLVTTDEVLIEFATHLGVRDERLRAVATAWVRAVLEDPGVDVVPQSRDTFLGGVALFESRPDKLYSLTDCISMTVMRTRGLSDALTHDRHFVQEGFVAIFR
ncbi:MAG: PIN domain-containing protein [Acidobacteria bacterium]|nr:PIN domain-containing protein [Acidobacteriota bacterium]